MKISPITLTNFGGGKVNINIPQIRTEKLYNKKEYDELARYTDADLTIAPAGRGVFYNPRVNRYKIDVCKVIDNGEKIEQSGIVEIDKTESPSNLESQIRNGVYHTYNLMLQSIVKNNLQTRKS